MKPLRQIDMTEGPILGGIVRFALPLMLTNLLQQFYNAMDSVIVGQYLGSKALAAVGSTGSLVNLFLGFFIGLGVGAGVIVSQAYGAHDNDRLEKAVHTSVAISIAASLMIGVVGVLAAEPILRLMGSPEDVLPLSAAYIRILFGGAVFAMLYNIGASILRAVGDSVRPLIYLGVCTLLNVGLNILFVTVFDMGVPGVGWATILAQAISTVLVLIELMTTKGAHRVRLSRIRFHKSVFGDILRLGMPAGVQSCVVSFSNVIIQSFVNGFGPVYMAAFAAATKVDAFVYTPMNAVGLAATTFVGQNIGSKRYDRVRKGAKELPLIGIAAALIVGIPAGLCAAPLISLMNGEPEVVAAGAFTVRVLALSYFLIAVPEALAGVIRGSGRSLPPMLMSVWNMCIVRILWLVILLPIRHEFYMMVLCYPFSWICNTVTILLYVRFSDWLTSHERADAAREAISANNL